MPGIQTPIESLLNDLRNADPEKRDNAARELSKSRDPRAVDALLLDLDHADWKVRRNAAQALGAIGDTRAVELLIRALQDRTLTVRSRAAVALGRIKDKRALEPLVEAWLEAPHSEFSTHAAPAIQKFGAAALPTLLPVLSAHPERRAEVLGILGKIKHPDALNALLNGLSDDQPTVRRAAAESLTQLKERRAIPALRAALPQSDLATQRYIVRALAQLGAVEAIGDMLALLQDYEPFSPKSALYEAITEATQQLGNVPTSSKGGTQNTLLFVAGGLTDGDSAMLSDYLKGLAKRFEGQNADDQPFSMPTSNLISQMTSMVEKVPSAHRDALTGLLFLLNAPDPNTRIGAALSLAWHNDPRALEPLKQTASDSDANVQTAAQWALAVLEKMLRFRR
ncbi:MAG: HEAT repeat domain-containing protein [Chloroflexota bacterium]